ncbi:MAG: hypothetical protein N3D15_03110 [Syntrophorhabdaceae bacterium]|nr:hypothetical protein [Syntrophorhabdaceae bacterium]
MYRLSIIILLIVVTMPLILQASDRSQKTITGEVIFIDSKEKSILVKKVVGKQEYINGGVVDENTEFVVGGKKASIEDIKVHDRVTIFMTIKDDDVYVKKVIKK